jgi:hypothetical protein
VTGLRLDVAQAVIGFENRFCYLGDEPTTTRVRADTKALTSIVVACLVDPVGLHRSSLRPTPKKVEPKNFHS